MKPKRKQIEVWKGPKRVKNLSKTNTEALRKLISVFRRLISGFKGLIKGQRGLILGLTGLITGLRALRGDKCIKR